jgi:hypothetical protein
MSGVHLGPEEGVFELAGPKPTWIWAHTCPTPRCPCRTAILASTREGRNVLLRHAAPIRDAWNSGASHAQAAKEVSGLLVFALDIDRAAAYPIDGHDRIDLHERRDEAAVVERIDGDLLDELGCLWLKGKGLANPEQAIQRANRVVIQGWRQGEMVAWNDLFKGVRHDLYWIGDRVYEAAEAYCPVPKCDCFEVYIGFDTRTPRGGPKPGSVRVLRSAPPKLDPNKGRVELLEQLWAAFRARHARHEERFARRYEIVKKLGAKMPTTEPTASTSTTRKVGPNDPCPCGSGKKFKKCCRQ